MQLPVLLAMVSLRAALPLFSPRGRRCLATRFARSHGDDVEAAIELLRGPHSRVSPYWIEQLRRVEKPSAQRLIRKLVPDNALGYISSTTMIEKIKGYREQFSDKVILTRCGDFYEAYGIDAVMLVAWAGANPMNSRGDVQAKAGCPKQNIQNTLDGLTEAGLSVAVIEELPDSNANTGPARKNQPKERGLAQIVSPSLRTYAYGSIMRTEDISFPENRPAVGRSSYAGRSASQHLQASSSPPAATQCPSTTSTRRPSRSQSVSPRKEFGPSSPALVS